MKQNQDYYERFGQSVSNVDPDHLKRGIAQKSGTISMKANNYTAVIEEDESNEDNIRTFKYYASSFDDHHIV